MRWSKHQVAFCKVERVTIFGSTMGFFSLFAAALLHAT